ncbi:MAG TPA: DUF3311 domain-containing protein [Steroidobacteraceae bacterium]|jgi:hypothetical protein
MKPAAPAAQVSGALIAQGELAMNGTQKHRRGWSWWYLLFIVQFVAVLWPPFYNSAEPYWHGVPYFYWYQMMWVLISAVLTAIVYFATQE